MDLELFTDLVKDERGNYYTAVAREGDRLTLVNAFVERSYQDNLQFTEEFNNKYAEYERQFIGKIAADRLRHDVVFAMRQDGHGRLYDLAEVEQAYRVTYIDAIEFYRNPRSVRGSG